MKLRETRPCTLDGGSFILCP